ncbi:MAG: hypothetical protein ACREAA_20505 [Candidatus Polarisedimenticolia bacterium]
MPFVRDYRWSPFATTAALALIIAFVMLVGWLLEGCPAGGPW